MILGSAIGIEGAARFDTGRLDQVLQVALDEIAQNPIIDEQIRANPVIMKALSAAVTRTLNPDELKPYQQK